MRVGEFQRLKTCELDRTPSTDCRTTADRGEGGRVNALVRRAGSPAHRRRNHRYQQAADVALHFKFLVYSTYAAILVCTVFLVLIFWKLRNIADELRQFRVAFEMADDRKTQSAAPTLPRTDDDSRYLPKS